jgi:hypothetical protein
MFASRSLDQQYDARLKLASKWIVAGRTSRDCLRLKPATESGDTVSVDLRDLKLRQRFCSVHSHNKMTIPCEHVIHAIRMAEPKALQGDINKVLFLGSTRHEALRLYTAGKGLSIPATEGLIPVSSVKRPSWLKVRAKYTYT